MTDTEKWNRLEQLAEQDETYLVWKNSYDEFAPKFNRFLRWCPRKIRNFLCGYAECGRLMMQRMVNLACEHMEFPEEKI